MKKIISLSIFFLFLACGNSVIYREYNVDVSVGGYGYHKKGEVKSMGVEEKQLPDGTTSVTLNFQINPMIEEENTQTSKGEGTVVPTVKPAL